MKNQKIPYSFALPIIASCESGLPLHSFTGNFMEQEVWKDIIGYEGIYKISSLGKIKSIGRVIYHCDGHIQVRKIILIKKHSIGDTGYPYTTLSKDGVAVNKKIHRLVALHFIPNPNNKPQVNHKNGNKLDFSINNLEWCTHRENIIHAHKNGFVISAIGENNGRSKLTKEQVVRIKYLHSIGISRKDIMKTIGVVGYTAIRNIINKQTWKDIV